MPAKPDPATLPCSPCDETAGLKYFPRMLGKIRLFAAGKLWEDLHANLGKGSDGACTAFLHVNYDDLKARVLEGPTACGESSRGERLGSIRHTARM